MATQDDMFGGAAELAPTKGANKAPATITVEQSDLFGGEATVLTFQVKAEKEFRLAGKRIRTPADLERAREKALRRDAQQKNTLFLAEVCKRLGVQRVIEKGELVGYDVKPTSKTLFYGPTPNSSYPKGSFAREVMQASIIEDARRKLVSLFEMRDNEPLVYRATEILTARIRGARPNEDWQSIVTVFLEMFVQEDFLQNERSGLTIRNLKAQAKIDSARVRAKRRPRGKALAALDDDLVNASADVDITNLVETRCTRVVDQDDEDEELDDLHEELEQVQWEQQAERLAARRACSGESAEDADGDDDQVFAAAEDDYDDGESIVYVDEEAESLVDAHAVHMDWVDDEIDLVDFGQ